MHTKIVFFPVFCIHRQQQKYKSVKLIKVFYGKKHSLSSLVLRKNSRQISSSETTWTSTTSREKVSNEMYVWLTRALKQFSEEVVLAFRTNFDPKYFNVLHVFIAACSSSECFHLFVPFFRGKVWKVLQLKLAHFTIMGMKVFLLKFWVVKSEALRNTTRKKHK